MNSFIRLFAQTRFSCSIVQTPKIFLTSKNTWPALGSIKHVKKVGRGDRNGKGKTAGRGTKGWKARNGRNRPSPAYEGGQTGIIKASPEFGIDYKPLLELKPIGLDQIEYWISIGRLNPKHPVTIKELSALVGDVVHGVSLEEQGIEKFNTKIDIEVQEASPKVIKKILSLGGSMKCVYYDKEDLDCFLHPERYIIKPKDFLLPQDKKLIYQFSNPELAGYLKDWPREKIDMMLLQADFQKK